MCKDFEVYRYRYCATNLMPPVYDNVQLANILSTFKCICMSVCRVSDQISYQGKLSGD